ncbi:MAG: hypothetical protein ACYCPP_06315 [Nitrososphaerales archaeon]
MSMWPYMGKQRILGIQLYSDIAPVILLPLSLNYKSSITLEEGLGLTNKETVEIRDRI